MLSWELLQCFDTMTSDAMIERHAIGVANVHHQVTANDAAVGLANDVAQSMQGVCSEILELLCRGDHHSPRG